MAGLRSAIATLVFCLSSACGDGGARSVHDGAATPEPDADAPASQADSSEESGLDGGRDREMTDGSAAAASDTEGGHPDDAASGSGDAHSAVADAAVPSCSLDAGNADSCEAHLCKLDAGIALVLQQDEPWRVGALAWIGTICERSLGVATDTSDGHHLLYALTSADVREISAGVPVQVYWGNPDGSQVLPGQRCAFVPQDPKPACPATSWPVLHASLAGCRGPADPGCTLCRAEGPIGTFHRSATEGSNWYNSAFPVPTDSCAGTCPLCAQCTYRDEQQLQMLGPRPECEPCPRDNVIDPCYGSGTCACWCSQRKILDAKCPTLVPL